VSEPHWISPLFSSIDARDADGFSARLAPDVVFRFGNAEPVEGLESVRQAVAGFFQSIAGISHQVSDTWVAGDAVICQGRVTYTRHDGSRLSVPFANIFRMSGERIREYLVFVDASHLYTPS
jgi:ketosteroid isomerase-like protein